MKSLMQNVLCAASSFVFLSQNCFAVIEEGIAEEERTMRASPSMKSSEEGDFSHEKRPLTLTQKEEDVLKIEGWIQDSSLRTFKMYLKFAAEGDLESQFMMSTFYGLQGIEPNPERAFDWCYAAAMDGHLSAQFRLAGKYERGEGVAQDLQKASLWQEKANTIHLKKLDEDYRQIREKQVARLISEATLLCEQVESMLEINNSQNVSFGSEEPQKKSASKSAQNKHVTSSPPRKLKPSLLKKTKTTSPPSKEKKPSPPRKIKKFVRFKKSPERATKIKPTDETKKNSSFMDFPAVGAEGSSESVWEGASGFVRKTVYSFPFLHDSSDSTGSTTDEKESPLSPSFGKIQDMTRNLWNSFSFPEASLRPSSATSDEDNTPPSRNSSFGNFQEGLQGVSRKLFGKFPAVVSSHSSSATTDEEKESSVASSPASSTPHDGNASQESTRCVTPEITKTEGTAFSSPERGGPMPKIQRSPEKNSQDIQVPAEAKKVPTRLVTPEVRQSFSGVMENVRGSVQKGISSLPKSPHSFMGTESPFGSSKPLGSILRTTQTFINYVSPPK